MEGSGNIISVLLCPLLRDKRLLAYKPTGLYNAMIAPLLVIVRDLVLSGIRGESNVSRRNEYKDLLTAMISDWRQQ